MLLEDLATELIAHVYLSCNSISDVIALSNTCLRLRRIYNAPGRRLQILARASEAEYGPLQEVIQLVTHNASQPAHVPRDVPLSFALLKQVVAVGRIAKRWEDEIYPFKRWREDYEDRRLLTDAERYSLRRALYRLWLYSNAFHNSAHPRTSRMNRAVVLERAELLHNFSNDELAEMADVQAAMRDTLSLNICPSNGTVQRKFRKRFPETNYQLLFNMHLNYPPPITMQMSPQQQHQYKYYAKYRPTATHEPGCEGWGDDINHYYVIEDMLKLDPGQILWLRDNAPSKSQVESYVRGLGEWFDNNGDTFGQTLELVLDQRGVEVGKFIEAVAEHDLGVAKDCVQQLL